MIYKIVSIGSGSPSEIPQLSIPIEDALHAFGVRQAERNERGLDLEPEGHLSQMRNGPVKDALYKWICEGPAFEPRVETAERIARFHSAGSADFHCLDLSQLGLTSTMVPWSILKAIRPPEILNLVANDIDSIPEDAFEGLATIQMVNLSWNKIETLSTATIAPIFASEIRLNGNPLDEGEFLPRVNELIQHDSTPRFFITYDFAARVAQSPTGQIVIHAIHSRSRLNSVNSEAPAPSRGMRRSLASTDLWQPPRNFSTSPSLGGLSFPSGRGGSSTGGFSKATSGAVSPNDFFRQRLGVVHEGGNEGDAPQREDNECAPLLGVFEGTVKNYLPVAEANSLLADDFWMNPRDTRLITNTNGHNLFMGWVALSGEIEVATYELIDPAVRDHPPNRRMLADLAVAANKAQFDSDMADILRLYRNNEGFRAAAQNCIFNSNGCGDRQASIYCVLKATMPIYLAQTPTVPEVTQLYGHAYIPQVIIGVVMDLNQSGDEAGQIRWAMQALSRTYNLGMDHLVMSNPFTGDVMLPFRTEIGNQVAARLSECGFYEDLVITNPAFEPIRADLKERIAHAKKRLADERDEKFDALMARLALDETDTNHINEGTYNTEAKKLEPEYEQQLRLAIREIVHPFIR